MHLAGSSTCRCTEGLTRAVATWLSPTRHKRSVGEIFRQFEIASRPFQPAQFAVAGCAAPHVSGRTFGSLDSWPRQQSVCRRLIPSHGARRVSSRAFASGCLTRSLLPQSAMAASHASAACLHGVSCLGDGDEGGPAEDGGLVGEDATGPLASGRVIAIEQATPSVKVFWIDARLEQETSTPDVKPTCVASCATCIMLCYHGPLHPRMCQGTDTAKFIQKVRAMTSFLFVYLQISCQNCDHGVEFFSMPPPPPSMRTHACVHIR